MTAVIFKLNGAAFRLVPPIGGLILGFCDKSHMCGFNLLRLPDLFANGANLHLCIEQFLTGRRDQIEIRSGNEGHWESIEPVLREVSGIRCVEEPVRHGGLKYCGVIDCVAEYR